METPLSVRSHGGSGPTGGACALGGEGTGPTSGAGTGPISGAGNSACVVGDGGVVGFRPLFRRGERGRAGAEDFRLLRLWRGDCCKMEVGLAAEDGRDGPRERRGLGEAERPQQNHEVRPQSGADRLPKHSYWLDLWLFVLLDVVLFFFVYFLPW